MGKFIVEELLKTGKHAVTAITRTNSTSTFADGVKVAKVDYDDHNSLVQALQGQEVLIITMGVMAPPDQQTKLFKAAADANVPWVLPNEWGYDSSNKALTTDIKSGPVPKAEYSAQIEKLGKSSWIGINCSFWYEFSLGGGPERYGFDFKNRTLTYFDDGEQPINTTTWPQCGRAIVGLLSLKVFPEDVSDKSPSLAQFKNQHIRISSFCVSQKDMFKSVQRVTGTTEQDWKIDSEPSDKRYRRGLELMGQGNMAGFAMQMYTRVFYPDGSGNYEASLGLENDILGLPKEDIDEYTKKAVEFAEKPSAYR